MEALVEALVGPITPWLGVSVAGVLNIEPIGQTVQMV
jgi:hypothetical protein